MDTKKAKISLNKYYQIKGMLFMLPGFLGFVVFILIPVIFTLYYAVFDAGGNFALVSNFYGLFMSRSFILAMTNTFLYLIAGGGIGMLFSFITSYMLFSLIKSDMIGTAFVKISCLMPMILPAGVVALFAQLLFSNSGTINSIFGTKIDFLTTSPYTFWILVLLYIWKNFGYSMIIFIAAFSGIQPNVYEAARCDGAGSARILWSIVIPQIKSSFFFVTIMSIIGVFKMNRESYLLYGDYPSESAYMFQNFINNNIAKLEFNRAACSATVLFLIFSVLVFFMVRASEKGEE